MATPMRLRSLICCQLSRMMKKTNERTWASLAAFDQQCHWTVVG